MQQFPEASVRKRNTRVPERQTKKKSILSLAFTVNTGMTPFHSAAVSNACKPPLPNISYWKTHTLNSPSTENDSVYFNTLSGRGNYVYWFQEEFPRPQNSR